MFTRKDGTRFNLPKARILSITTLLLCISFASLGVDMFGWFKNKEEVLLSSSIHGKITNGKIPLQGVTVYRKLSYGKEYSDNTVTDNEGHFNFPPKIIHSDKPGNMLDNDPIQQDIYIKQDNNKLTLWGIYFLSFSPKDKTIQDHLNNLICDVNDSGQTYDVPVAENTDHDFTIYSICKLK